METQTKYGGLGPPGTLRTGTSELPPEGDELEAKTYLFMGFGTRSWVRYRLRHGYAIVERTRPPTNTRFVDIRGAEFEVSRSWFADRGSVRIFARNGQCLVWRGLRELSFVVAVLKRAAGTATQ